MTVAALYVETGGVYYGLPDVDPWDITRDARLYAGPHPVVAHPPCTTWGIFAKQGKTLRKLGDDDGCFEAALASVRKWGGVLEHPADSAAWRRYGLLHAPYAGGWVNCDFKGGWTCRVEQGHFGHRARKATWLYSCGSKFLPTLPWAASSKPLDAFDGMSKNARARTPVAFRDLLLSIARSSRPQEAA